MTDTASISALISAAAVVGALTTSSIVTWYVEVSQLLGDIGARSKADTKNDTKTREFTARLKPLQTRRHALLWVQDSGHSGRSVGVICVLTCGFAGVVAGPGGLIPR